MRVSSETVNIRTCPTDSEQSIGHNRVLRMERCIGCQGSPSSTVGARVQRGHNPPTGCSRRKDGVTEGSLRAICVSRKQRQRVGWDGCCAFAAVVSFARRTRQTAQYRLVCMILLVHYELISMKGMPTRFSRVSHDEMRTESFNLVFVGLHLDDRARSILVGCNKNIALAS